MKLITTELVLSFGPCERYDEEKLRKLLGDGLPLASVMELNVPNDDKCWLIFREEFIEEKDLHGLACKYAEEVLPIFEEKYPTDKRPRQAIETKRAWLSGDATEEQLIAASAASRNAAWDAAWDAARDAAMAAAFDAARSAAWAASRAAASDAASAASMAAARAAQIKTALDVVKEEWK